MRRADATAWSGDANITRCLIDSEGAARGAYPGAVIGVRKMVVARSRTLFARRQPSLKQAHDHCDHDDHPSIPPPRVPGASHARSCADRSQPSRGEGPAAEPSGGGPRISLGPSSLGPQIGRCGSPNLGTRRARPERAHPSASRTKGTQPRQNAAPPPPRCAAA